MISYKFNVPIYAILFLTTLIFFSIFLPFSYNDCPKLKRNWDKVCSYTFPGVCVCFSMYFFFSFINSSLLCLNLKFYYRYFFFCYNSLYVHTGIVFVNSMMLEPSLFLLYFFNFIFFPSFFLSSLHPCRLRTLFKY